MIQLQEVPEGVVLLVRAAPGARKTEIRGWHGEALKVAVTQVAEKGKANKAIFDLLSAALGVKKSQLELLAGQTSATKKVLVRDVTAGVLAERVKRFV